MTDFRKLREAEAKLRNCSSGMGTRDITKYTSGLSVADAVFIAAELDRLNQCLKWEQHRSGRQGTHSEDCHTWGPQHYECLLREYKRATAALAEAEREVKIERAAHHLMRDLRNQLADELTEAEKKGWEKAKQQAAEVVDLAMCETSQGGMLEQSDFDLVAAAILAMEPK